MIKINSLLIENFMCITKAEFSFDSSVIMISGRSGQGKSAVFDAIALCISSKKRSSQYGEYVKQGCTHSKIILDCIINSDPVNFNLQINLVRGTPYQMETTYKGKVYKNSEADELLKSFDIEYYADIIFSMQSDDFRDITQLSPTQRANYLQRLLNFDFSIQKEKLLKDLDQLKQQQIKIYDDINLNEKFILKEKQEIEKIIEILIKEELIEKYKSDIEEKQKQIEQYKIIQEEKNNLNEELSIIQSLLITQNKQEQTLEHEINSLKELSKQIVETEKTIENNIVDIQKNKKLIEIYNNGLLEEEKKQRNNEQKSMHFFNVRARNMKLRDDLIKIETLQKEKKCMHCGQDTTIFADKEFKILLDQYEITENFSTIRDGINKIERIVLDSDMDIGDAKRHEKEIIKSITDTKLAIQKYTSKLNDLENENKKYYHFLKENNYDPIELKQKEKLLETVEENIKNNILKKDNIDKKLKDLQNDDDISILSSEIVTLTNTINKFYTDKKQNVEIKSRNEKRENNIKIYEDLIEKHKENLGIFTNQSNVIEEAFSILDKTLPNYMVVKTCSALQNEMNNFIQNIFPNYEVKLQNSKKGCEFFYTKDRTVLELERKRNNAWINTKMSSGFEKALLTAAFKVSLAQLYGINLLILDEIEGAADNVSSELLFTNLLNSNFDQLFIISHKPDLKDFILDNTDDSILYSVTNGQFSRTETTE